MMCTHEDQNSLGDVPMVVHWWMVLHQYVVVHQWMVLHWTMAPKKAMALHHDH